MKKYILFDTEYTAWKNSLKTNWSKEGQYKEIIQISALKINNNKIIDNLNLYVKPLKNPKLSSYIIRLTGITNNKLKKDGISFEKAIHLFYDFAKGYKLYSYGNDYSIIYENLKIHSIDKKKYTKYFTQSFKNKFYDYIDLIKKYEMKTKTKINISLYTSGTLYKAFDINMGKKHKIHNSMNDVKSLFEVSKIINE
jgi:DNA polymerase III epsilon subunit-like protein